MTNEQIREKYGIEPIMKEMWVWDENPKKAMFGIVTCKVRNEYTYLTAFKDGDWAAYKNASETNPNYKEPKIGDKGYFWDNERYYAYDLLNNIIDTHGISSMRGFRSSFCGDFQYFSHEKQPWMK